jgi:hypothetical protein
MMITTMAIPAPHPEPDPQPEPHPVPQPAFVSHAILNTPLYQSFKQEANPEPRLEDDA